MMIHIPQARLLIDETLSPRERLDRKHVDEFVEIGGEWPAVLVRPIEHEWYTHQLVDGFHRVAAAERLHFTDIEARVEAMSDEEAIARALRENLHGQPLTPEQRKAVCVRLAKMGLTQHWITKETGVTQGLVAQYLSAERVSEAIININNTPAPKLTLPQAAALGKLVPNEYDNRRTSPGPRLFEDPRREAARQQVPTLAKAASDHKLTPPVVSALADATLAAPEAAPQIIEKAVTDKLAPDAIRHAGKVMADPTAPPALKQHIMEPGTMVHDQHGIYPASERQRAHAEALAEVPETRALPMARFLTKLDDYRTVTDDAVAAWLDVIPSDEWEACDDLLTRICAWAEQVRRQISDRRKAGLRLVGR